MCLRLPEPTWAPGRGCTTVIGDALHPTQPTLAQGGCMALVRTRVPGVNSALTTTKQHSPARLLPVHHMRVAEPWPVVLDGIDVASACTTDVVSHMVSLQGVLQAPRLLTLMVQ